MPTHTYEKQQQQQTSSQQQQSYSLSVSPPPTVSLRHFSLASIYLGHQPIYLST